MKYSKLLIEKFEQVKRETSFIITLQDDILNNENIDEDSKIAYLDHLIEQSKNIELESMIITPEEEAFEEYNEYMQKIIEEDCMDCEEEDEFDRDFENHIIHLNEYESLYAPSYISRDYIEKISDEFDKFTMIAINNLFYELNKNELCVPYDINEYIGELQYNINKAKDDISKKKLSNKAYSMLYQIKKLLFVLYENDMIEANIKYDIIKDFGFKKFNIKVKSNNK